MKEKVMEYWRSDRWFRRIIYLSAVMLLVSLVLLFALGTHPEKAGELIYGDQEEQISLQPDHRYTYSFMVHKEHAAYSFVSSEKLEYYFLLREVNPGEPMQDISTEAFEKGNSTKETVYFEGPGVFTAVIITPPGSTIKFAHAALEFTPEQYQRAVYYAYGAFILKFAIGIPVAYVVVVLVVRYVKRLRSPATGEETG